MKVVFALAWPLAVFVTTTFTAPAEEPAGVTQVMRVPAVAPFDCVMLDEVQGLPATVTPEPTAK